MKTKDYVGPCKIFPKESHKPLIINYKIIKYKDYKI